MQNNKFFILKYDIFQHTWDYNLFIFCSPPPLSSLVPLTLSQLSPFSHLIAVPTLLSRHRDFLTISTSLPLLFTSVLPLSGDSYDIHILQTHAHAGTHMHTYHLLKCTSCKPKRTCNICSPGSRLVSSFYMLVSSIGPVSYSPRFNVLISFLTAE